jgi:TRAP-type mannitol/chloroaromatic compound transport system permease small subunit
VIRFLWNIDRMSAFAGKAFAWCIVLLTAVVSYDVAARYLFNAPTSWAFDASYILYGALFLMAGAYTLSRNGHVRGDVLYRLFPPRVQAGVDLALYLLFFLPGVAALAYAGIGFTLDSYAMRETSSVTTSGVPIYAYKGLIPIAGALVLLQGLAEIARCVICLRSGEWPPRLHDVEEQDVDALRSILDHRGSSS